MPDKTALTVVAFAVGGGIGAIIVYYIARFLRGSIKLSLPRTAFNPGDNITGSFDLHTKKAIQGNKLIVRLIGVQVTKSFENGKTRTRSREIYRDEVLVEGAKSYPAGYKATYNFEIPAPDIQSPGFLNSAVGQALTAALSLLGSRSTDINWKVEARLDAQGIDLAASKSVSINTRQIV